MNSLAERPLELFYVPESVNETTRIPPAVPSVARHAAPMIVEVTRDDGTSDKRMLLGVRTADGLSSRRFAGVERGELQVRLWFDTIRRISKLEGNRVEVELRDGSRHRLACPEQPRFVFLLESDGDETIAITRIQHVRFLSPARTDRLNNPMFDHWKFSPYTGERLSPQECMH